MKKFIAIFFMLLIFTGCSTAKPKTGLGFVTSRSAISSTENSAGRAQSNTTICTLTVDSKGIITKLSIDVTEAKFEIDNQGKITNDITENVRTNKELQDDYGLRKNSDIQKEWFEQVAEFEKWAVGKTVSDILAISTTKNDKNMTIPNVPELQGLVSMDISNFLVAIQKASDDINSQE